MIMLTAKSVNLNPPKINTVSFAKGVNFMVCRVGRLAWRRLIGLIFCEQGVFLRAAGGWAVLTGPGLQPILLG